MAIRISAPVPPQSRMASISRTPALLAEPSPVSGSASAMCGGGATWAPRTFVSGVWVAAGGTGVLVKATVVLEAISLFVLPTSVAVAVLVAVFVAVGGTGVLVEVTVGVKGSHFWPSSSEFLLSTEPSSHSGVFVAVGGTGVWVGVKDTHF